MQYVIGCLFVLLCSFSGILEGTVQTQYKMYCMYTPKFETMYTQYFLPSLKDDFELVTEVYPQDCETANFHSEGWEKTMLYKLELMIRAIRENLDDQVFFFSDIDIIFFKPILDISLEHLADLDFVVQQGWPRKGLCAGFFVMRGNERTHQLITTAYNLLKEKVCIDDQVAIQKALDDLPKRAIAWKYLPAEQYPNGRRLLKNPKELYTEDSTIELTDAMILFHANCCIGLDNKYHFLQRVQQLFTEKWDN
jgi:hypothetical protein